MTPNIPDDWEYFYLKNIRAFDSEFDILITKDQKKLLLRINISGKNVFEKTIQNGNTVIIEL